MYRCTCILNYFMHLHNKHVLKSANIILRFMHVFRLKCLPKDVHFCNIFHNQNKFSSKRFYDSNIFALSQKLLYAPVKSFLYRNVQNLLQPFTASSFLIFISSTQFSLSVFLLFPTHNIVSVAEIFNYAPVCFFNV